MSDLCPACEAGVLVTVHDDETITYNGHSLLVRGVAFSRCPVCAEEVVLPAQAKANDVLFADAKRNDDGLWTSARILEWRLRWGLSQQHAAALLGGGTNAFSKYERGEVIQSRSMDLLMRVSDEISDVRHLLSSRSGIAFGDDWKTVTQAEDVSPLRRIDVRAASRKMTAAMESFGTSTMLAANWADEEEPVLYNVG
ncbi:type II toxin-antitoxin system MqsA family antitoxin [Xanthomonas citri]|uniref:type II toxin-antitoxin system MqsA family antitoxin n=1 Tax=Xanthomonas citri TaxID=346 RepID=UPI001885A0F9|nr:type II toxin-antitoxin system MqsA family antitoxin [Xanthomonas citri]MBE2321227.1 type II toxin-antitoxin system MqsA family antitoxin [Solirubrobacter deserti]QOY23232.1 type II toxin-antitoxin system MqsA family antitoxin [Xanthomonas citri]QQK69393.1 type II toxin-antitoxin system MqsA family antitoxin [Xanthomonas citri]